MRNAAAFSVEIKEVPDLLKDYDLKSGDRITAPMPVNSDHQDALNLGAAGENRMACAFSETAE
ncbi:hypothetical protein MASR1M12_26040 [Erysipelotrichia bacterium]